MHAWYSPYMLGTPIHAWYSIYMLGTPPYPVRHRRCCSFPSRPSQTSVKKGDAYVHQESDTTIRLYFRLSARPLPTVAITAAQLLYGARVLVADKDGGIEGWGAIEQVGPSMSSMLFGCALGRGVGDALYIGPASNLLPPPVLDAQLITPPPPPPPPYPGRLLQDTVVPSSATQFHQVPPKTSSSTVSNL